jgi:4-amino-4-deoxy-L-arabinose transferase-like glycosyltransferase
MYNDNEHRQCIGKRWLVVVFLLALGTRVGYALLAEGVDPFLGANLLHGDAGSYDRIARSLLAGAGFAQYPGVPTAFWPPLYPLFLAALYRLFGYSLLAARLAQALLGAVTAAATAAAARGAFGLRVGLLAGLGMALYPHLIYFDAWLIAEALYLALLALALWLAVEQQGRPRPWGFALLGALLGLATLAKPATLMLLPLVGWWVWIAPPERPTRDRAMQAALTLSLAAVVIAPWTVRNYQVFRAFIPVSANGGYTFYGANNADAFGGHREGFPPMLPGLAEPQAESEYYRRALDWITDHPRDVARLTVRKLVRLFSPLSVASWEQDYPLPLAPLVKAAYTAFLVLAFLGALWSRSRWRELAIFYILIWRVLLGAVLFYGDARYTLPMVPSLVTFAALALVVLYHRQHTTSRAASPALLRHDGGTCP